MRHRLIFLLGVYYLYMSLKEYFKAHSDYLHDNPNNYWFKAKLYGWGWTPVRWQGWSVVALYLVLVLGIVSLSEKDIPGNPDSGTNVLTFALPILVLTVLLLVIAYKKGEKPRWQWGPPKKNDSSVEK